MDLLDKIYLGALFDVDGTLADKETEVIPDYLGEYLADFSTKVPVAICTGRRLDLLTDKMGPIWKYAVDINKCKGNWIFICENGAIGYKFDVETEDYNEFYRVSFPISEERRVELFNALKKAMEGKIGHCYMNKVTLVFAPSSRGSGNSELMRQESREMALIADPIIKEFDPSGEIAIGDSGIAINIIPKKGDKDRGILEFGNYLKENRGLELSEDMKELVCVGDQPGPGCNDELFLSGKYGTPFTVGEKHPLNEVPSAVVDKEGHTIKGPRGTLYLLRNLNFSV